MLGSRRVRTLATLGVLTVALGLATGPADPAAVAAPRTFTIVGGGYGHGVGMSQYGAHGMALRGAGAGRIITFYHGGAPGPAGHPARPGPGRAAPGQPRPRDRRPPRPGPGPGGRGLRQGRQ